MASSVAFPATRQDSVDLEIKGTTLDMSVKSEYFVEHLELE